MEWIFNKIYVINNLTIFSCFLVCMILGIIIAFLLALKELKKQDDN